VGPVERLTRERDSNVQQLSDRDARISRLQRELADKAERLGRLTKELSDLKSRGLGKIFQR
jgi:predicted RNase H-like nuclease (RuvC/YqgF family)